MGCQFSGNAFYGIGSVTASSFVMVNRMNGLFVYIRFLFVYVYM